MQTSFIPFTVTPLTPLEKPFPLTWFLLKLTTEQRRLFSADQEAFRKRYVVEFSDGLAAALWRAGRLSQNEKYGVQLYPFSVPDVDEAFQQFVAGAGTAAAFFTVDITDADTVSLPHLA